MESAAVVRVAQARNDPRRALVIRGISDYGDPRKKELDAHRQGRPAQVRHAQRRAFSSPCWRARSAALPPSVSPSPSPSPATGSLPTAHVSIARLPTTSRDLFGRKAELAWLDRCWAEGVRVASIVAFGGVGKSALVNTWLAEMDKAAWRGAERVYGWSFYSQGTDRLTSSDEFVDAALRWFGDPDPTQGSAWDKGERLATLVRRERTILVLDGLEPLQWGPTAAEPGRLKDVALTALVKELGAQNKGLCVITSRIKVADVGGHKVEAHDLDHLSAEAGAELLAARGATGARRRSGGGGGGVWRPLARVDAARHVPAQGARR